MANALAARLYGSGEYASRIYLGIGISRHLSIGHDPPKKNLYMSCYVLRLSLSPRYLYHSIRLANLWHELAGFKTITCSRARVVSYAFRTFGNFLEHPWHF